MHKFLWDFEIQMDHLGQTTRISDSQQTKKSTCQTVDFAVPADYKVKFKESEKKDLA